MARCPTHGQLRGVIVFLWIRLCGLLLVACALVIIGRSKTPRSATVLVEDSVAGRLLHARITIMIVIRERHHRHGFDAFSRAGYIVATALGFEG